MLVHVARGLLGGLTNKVNEVQKTAQGYKNKAEGKENKYTRLLLSAFKFCNRFNFWPNFGQKSVGSGRYALPLFLHKLKLILRLLFVYSLEKVKEAKKKAEALPGKVMSKLPAGLGKRKLSNLENDKIVPLERSDDGGLDNDMNKRQGNLLVCLFPSLYNE